MLIVDLEQIYPNIREFCKKWDCGFNEAVKRIEREKKKGELERWL